MQLDFQRSRTTGYYGFRNLFHRGASYLGSRDGLVLIGLPREVRLWIRPIASDTDPAHLVFYEKEYEMDDLTGCVVVDIGAGSGDSAIYFASRGASKVYAYEPSPESFKLAQRNIAENKLGGVVKIFNEGVSDFEGIGSLKWKPGEPWSGRITKDQGGVQVTSIAKVLKGKVDLLKLDCEGCEFGILRAMEKMQLFRFVDSIILEYEANPSVLIRRLRNAGYELSIDTPRRGIIQARCQEEAFSSMQKPERSFLILLALLLFD